MARASKTHELSLKLPDRIGLLKDITAPLTRAGINITAICAYEEEGEAWILFVTDDNKSARAALAGLGAEMNEIPVVAVEMMNEPGELERVAERIADAGITIGYMYGTTGPSGPAVCIIKTADADATIAAINA